MTTQTQEFVETIRGDEYRAEIEKGTAIAFGSKIGTTTLFTVRIFHLDAKPGEPAATVFDRTRLQDARRSAKSYVARYDYHLKQNGVRFEVAIRAQREAAKRDRRIKAIAAGLADFTVAELDRIISAAVGEKIRKGANR